jgi:hypothetical protein
MTICLPDLVFYSAHKGVDPLCRRLSCRSRCCYLLCIYCYYGRPLSLALLNGMEELSYFHPLSQFKVNMFSQPQIWSVIPEAIAGVILKVLLRPIVLLRLLSPPRLSIYFPPPPQTEQGE